MSSATVHSRSAKAAPGVDFGCDAPIVARQLIGATLLLNGVGGVIVETEAYDEAEAASHSYPGPTLRNAVLFGPPGRAYVYLSYGIHWCLNVSCREAGHGAGVLIRALQPERGVAEMMRRRQQSDIRKLCAGPGQLGQALAITAALNGKRIDARPFRLVAASIPPKVVRGARIGISKAIDLKWRFGLSGSAFLSRPFR